LFPRLHYAECAQHCATGRLEGEGSGVLEASRDLARGSGGRQPASAAKRGCTACGSNARACRTIRTFADRAIRWNSLCLKCCPHRCDGEYRTENLKDHDRSDWVDRQHRSPAGASVHRREDLRPDSLPCWRRFPLCRPSIPKSNLAPATRALWRAGSGQGAALNTPSVFRRRIGRFRRRVGA
jgi:hypothetical protein